jgi:hypothetical protein
LPRGNGRERIGAIDPAGIPNWAVEVHRLALEVHDRGLKSDLTGVFPPIIPKVLQSSDPTGTVEIYNLDAPTHTATNAFFESLGTNGRACATCHEPRSAWSVSADSIQRRFDESDGTDPIFRPVDGATCPSDNVSMLAARRTAYSLLLSKGLIRIFLPLPSTRLGTNPPVPRDYEIAAVTDPYGCTDLLSHPPMVAVYRRPLPSANLRFLTECPPNQTTCAPLSIMWDGREPSFHSQSIDATLAHAQALNPPTESQIAQIINFETSIFDAQESDDEAGNLHALQAAGRRRCRSRSSSSESTMCCHRDSRRRFSRFSVHGRTSHRGATTLDARLSRATKYYSTPSRSRLAA